MNCCILFRRISVCNSYYMTCKIQGKLSILDLVLMSHSRYTGNYTCKAVHPSCKFCGMNRKKIILTNFNEYFSIVRFHFNLSKSSGNGTWSLTYTTSSLRDPFYAHCGKKT